MSNLSVLLLGLALAGLAVSLACANPNHPSAGSNRLTRLEIPAPPDSAVHSTIDAAVEAAFMAARRADRPRGRDRLRIGTIRRVEGGFSWVEPRASESSVGALRLMQVRLSLRPDDVAIYGIHPISGHADFDRANEVVSRDERRLVDEHDPLHRPIYVLTPSRRVVRYPEVERSVEIVQSESGGSARR